MSTTYPRKWRIYTVPTEPDGTTAQYPWWVRAEQVDDDVVASREPGDESDPEDVYYMGGPDSIVEQISGGSFETFAEALGAVIEAQTAEHAARFGPQVPPGHTWGDEARRLVGLWGGMQNLMAWCERTQSDLGHVWGLSDEDVERLGAADRAGLNSLPFTDAERAA